MKKKLFQVFAVTLSFFSLFVSCAPPPAGTVFSVGDTGPSGVGIVFYISAGGLHGLEAAPSLWNAGAADPSSAWSTITDAFANGVSALPAGIGTGSANTDAIIAQNGNAASAAKLCRAYNGGGKTDWFLPSKDELNELYPQRNTVGNFRSEYYWCSSEGTADTGDTAWSQYFNNTGMQDGLGLKDTMEYIRPVRAF